MLPVLSQLLPPPGYLMMPCIGVDISDTSLKYLAFDSHPRPGADRVIEQWGDITIPGGVVKRGEVLDPEQLVSVLQEFKAQTKAEFVRVSLPEERAYLFETEVKKDTPQKEIRGLLEFRLEENVPIPSRDVYFDYHILPLGSDTRHAQVSVAAYARETVQTYYDACVAAGLYPISFEVEAQAMARAVIPRNTNGAVMLVDFGKTRTGIGIVYQDALLYTSTIDVGGDQLSQVLRKVLGEEVSEKELTTVKNTQGLIRGRESSDVRDALLSTLSVIKDELATRMEYWHVRNGNSDIRRINSVILCGGSANLKGLPAYLTETLEVPTARANVWENTCSLEESVPPIDWRHSFGYATAIGLALKSTV